MRSSLHSELLELRKTLSVLAPKEKWSQEFKTQLKYDFTHYSNYVEGNRIPYGATIQLLEKGIIRPKSPYKDVSDLQNHHKVLDAFFDYFDSLEISEELLKNFHAQMMADLLQWDSVADHSPGTYRWGETGTYRPDGWQDYMKPREVPKAMSAFVAELNERHVLVDESVLELYPIKVATWAHLRLLNEIHPFKDGNGRIGRIVVSMILMRNGYAPFIPMNKEKYLEAVFASNVEDPEALELFMATTVRDLMAKQLAEVKA
jgi:Fic family protein